MDDLYELLGDQDGVVSRQQVLASGLAQTQLARLLRRGTLVQHHPGVYVEHNGPLTYQQRCQAAVLSAWPSALCLDSALRAAEGPGRRDRTESVIQVAVDRQRHLTVAPGISLHRMAGFADRVQWSCSPPRVRYDESVLDVAAAATDDLAAIARLADAVGSRRTTASRLLACLGARERIHRRAWLEAVLADVAQGTCSVLERGYQSEVVRPHGLPAGILQAQHVTGSGKVLRDVALPELGLLVELDGRIFHSAAADRDRDLERDLDAAAERAALTVRLGYQQVFGRACSTAARPAIVMQRRGWTGTASECRLCGGLHRAG